METIKTINFWIFSVFFLCYSYQFFYIIVSLFFKHKPHKPTKMHKYAVLISARNEKAVIAQLIDSINAQTYPKELITTFVVADNCTDNTAELARNAGAVVYERFNKINVGKGYALEYLLDMINQDYADSPFDAYFIFDADNILDENYISEMNKTFSDGHKIITSYRNSKNYGDNWISAGYALWFLREAKFLNNARMLLNTSCAVSGTGFMFAREIIEKSGGWKFFLLTEDIQFTIHNVVGGEKIAYCHNAVLYDEQPVTFKQSWNQRMRWAKGYLQVFRNYGFGLAANIFKKHSFSCFDMCMTIMPALILTTTALFINLCATVTGLLTNQNIFIAVFSVLEELVNAYFMLFWVGAITTITEWKHIMTENYKKILYTFTFPFFMITYIPIAFVAIFKKVEWTPIVHSKSKTLAEIRNKKSKV